MFVRVFKHRNETLNNLICDCRLVTFPQQNIKKIFTSINTYRI